MIDLSICLFNALIKAWSLTSIDHIKFFYWSYREVWVSFSLTMRDINRLKVIFATGTFINDNWSRGVARLVKGEGAQGPGARPSSYFQVVYSGVFFAVQIQCEFSGSVLRFGWKNAFLVKKNMIFACWTISHVSPYGGSWTIIRNIACRITSTRKYVTFNSTIMIRYGYINSGKFENGEHLSLLEVYKYNLYLCPNKHTTWDQHRPTKLVSDTTQTNTNLSIPNDAIFFHKPLLPIYWSYIGLELKNKNKNKNQGLENWWFKFLSFLTKSGAKLEFLELKIPIFSENCWFWRQDFLMIAFSLLHNYEVPKI